MATSIRLAPETEQRLDYYLGSEVLERVRKGQEKVHSAADLRSELGLDDGYVDTGKALTGPLGGLWRYRVGDN